MTISINKFLKKMESELHKANQANSSAEIRERVHSIKVLCELILEENRSESTRLPSPQPTSQMLVTPTLSTKKLEDEEANGDSLFDF